MAEVLTTKRNLQVEVIRAAWKLHEQAQARLTAGDDAPEWSSEPRTPADDLMHVSLRALELMGRTLAEFEPDQTPSSQLPDPA